MGKILKASESMKQPENPGNFTKPKFKEAEGRSGNKNV